MPLPRETRTQEAGSLRIERRGEGDSAKRLIVGHASVFNKWTTIYEGRYFTLREIVRPGAYKRAIKEKQDVRCLLNHDANFVLGRTRSGTTTIAEDEVGLMTETDPPDTQLVRDLVMTPIERGDMSGMSFAFTARVAEKIVTTENADGSQVIERGGDRITLRYEGERRIAERELLDVDLYDVSPVTYPAYEETDVALRSVPGIEEYAREMDRPFQTPAPKRNEVRRWLDKGANPAPGPR